MDQLYPLNTGYVTGKGKNFYGELAKSHPEIQGTYSMPVFSYLHIGDNGKVTLFDTGMSKDFPMGAGIFGKIRSLMFTPNKVNEVTDQLLERGIKGVDEVVFSHLHSDHITGVVNLLKSIPVGKIYAHSEELRNAGNRMVYPKQLIKTLKIGEIESSDISYVYLPGHTKGHIGLDLGSVALVGDAIESVISLEGEVSLAIKDLASKKLLLSAHELSLKTGDGNFLDSDGFQMAFERQRKALQRIN